MHTFLFIAVKVLSPTKRPATTSHSKSSSAKRSQLGESQSAITHTGSPVNPFTAKALASKLNERNSMLNGSNGSQKHLQSKSSGSTNKTTDIPMPPLISIQHSQQQQQQLHLQHQKQTHLLQPLQTVQHRAYDSECESQNGMTSETNQMLSKTGDDLEVDLNVPAFNILKKSPNQNSACESNKLIMSELKGMHSSSSSDELNQVCFLLFMTRLEVKVVFFLCRRTNRLISERRRCTNVIYVVKSLIR